MRKLLRLMPIAFVVASCTDSVNGAELAGAELTPARPKANFTLTATNGQPYQFRHETDGHLTLLFFGYTHCPDVCPVHLTNIAAALQRLTPGERARIRVVFITTDPARDSLAQLRTWLDNFDTTFVGLRGPRDSITVIESDVGVAPSVVDTTGEYGVGHAAQILAFTPDDSLRVMYPFGVRQQDWARDLPRLLKVGTP